VEYAPENYYAESLRLTQQGALSNKTKTVHVTNNNDNGTGKPGWKPLWTDLGLKQCRFPASFFDIGKTRYNLSSTHGQWVDPEQWRQSLMAQQFDITDIPEQTNEYHQMLLRKQQSNFSSLQLARNISFIHVGKAGGSSVGCHLAASRRFVRKHCENRQMPVPLSALSMHVNCYTHWQGHMHCYDINDSYLVNIRNPIKRIASWFLYEHVRNHPVNYLE
jgi:hypothetical protein